MQHLRKMSPRLFCAFACFGFVFLSACSGGNGSSAGVDVQPPAMSPPPGISLLAGGLGGAGWADGPLGRFSRPTSVVMDRTGNLYVTDTGNYVIRKVTPAGAISTFAGKVGIKGEVDATGTMAGFANPTGIAVAASGNFYVADNENGKVQKVTPNGDVTTLADVTTRFCVAVDAAENIYVAESDTISKVSVTGVISKLATGVGILSAIALDASGVIYALSGNAVLRISTAGQIQLLAGSPIERGSTDGVGTVARFESPSGIVVDSGGNVYIADSGNKSIRKISPARAVTTIASNQTNGSIGSSANFLYPSGITLDTAGNIYVADSGNSTLRKITLSGTVTNVAGIPTDTGSADARGAAAKFSNAGFLGVSQNESYFASNSGGPSSRGNKFAYAANLALDRAGNVYVADSGNNTIRKITPDGSVSTLAGTAGIRGFADGPATTATFDNPNGVAVDAAGNVYVADTGNHKIRKISNTGTVTTVAGANWEPFRGSFSVSNTSFKPGSVPVSIAVDATGNIFVADPGVGLIRKITSSGIESVFYVDPFPIGFISSGIYGLSPPSSVAVDTQGNVYATSSCAVLKFTVGGAVSVLAGIQMSALGGVCGASDGVGAAAGLRNPTGLMIDTQGNAYVADTGNHTIRKITPTGVVTTVAGRTGVYGVVLGEFPGTLTFPVGMAIDAMGALYTTSENAVLKIQLQ